jgi:hypothetical protein
MAEVHMARRPARGRLLWLIGSLVVLLVIALLLLRHGGNDGIENAGPTGAPVNPNATSATPR